MVTHLTVEQRQLALRLRAEGLARCGRSGLRRSGRSHELVRTDRAGRAQPGSQAARVERVHQCP